MLGYVLHDGETDANPRFAALARELMAEGLRLTGTCQTGGDRGREMSLVVLGPSERVIRISQSLGDGARGCRLDSDALERAAGMVAGALATGVDLVLVNKFGKQEADGRGFRGVIGQALSRGTPVLTTVGPDQLRAFAEFAGALAVPVAWDSAAGWCRGAVRMSA